MDTQNRRNDHFPMPVLKHTTVNEPAFSCSVGYTDAHIAGGNIYPSHLGFASACSFLLSVEALLPYI